MKFLVNKQEIIRIDSDRIIAGSQNFVEAQFDFDDDWNELLLTVCFKNGDVRRAVCNVHSGESFFVPWEVLRAGNLYIYVEGYDGNVRVTTAKMKKPVVINKNGFFKCDAIKPPSASVYDMLLQAYAIAQKSVDSLLDSAAKGVFDGKGLEFTWEGTRLGVKKQGDEEYSFIDLKGAKGEKGDDGNTALLNIINANKNLVGTEGKILYPVLLPKGTTLTMSTSDGSTLVTPTDYLTLNCYRIDKTNYEYWSFNPVTTPKNSRTFVLKEDTYYLSWNKTWTVPIQVEIGAVATEYEEYKGSPFVANDGSIADLENSLSDKLDKNQGVFNAGKILSVGNDGNIICTENTFNKSTIITKEIENSLNQALRGTNTGSGNSNVLSLSVFTDIHHDKENLERYIDFCNNYDSKINEKLCLGDMVSAKFSDDFTFWTNLSGSNNILCTVGNHDTWVDGTTTGGSVAKTDVYNKFFANNIANWGVTQPTSASYSGLMYYYKDYAEHNVRLIVLDCMFYDDAENSWFVSVLADAKEKGLHVICASHYQPSRVLERIENCNFYSTQYNYTNMVTFDTRACANVDAFIGNGGKFIAWLCGDTHWDAFGEINGANGKQLVLTFECACAHNSRWYDSARIKGTLSQDSINFVAIDTYSGLIKVVRVGNNSDMYLKKKDCFCYDYQTHKLI